MSAEGWVHSQSLLVYDKHLKMAARIEEKEAAKGRGREVTGALGGGKSWGGETNKEV